MRKTFIETLTHLARHNERIFLLTGDLGFGVFEKFQKEFSKRFLNMGVAEQNMIGVASGLALSGKIPFVYSIAPFLILRALEQIRNDICYHTLNVKLIGVGGGFSYGFNGVTHYALEDIAVMKTLPNLSILCPGDPLEVQAAIQAVIQSPHPCYIRLGKTGEPLLHTSPLSFQIGKAITLQEGNDLTLISTGNMLENTLKVAQDLKKEGLCARVISMHTLKPLDREAIQKAAHETKVIVTIEEHNEIGGLGSSVADTLIELPHKIPFKKIAVSDVFSKVIGNHSYLRECFGLSKEKIIKTILEFIRHEITKKL